MYPFMTTATDNHQEKCTEPITSDRRRAERIRSTTEKCLAYRHIVSPALRKLRIFLKIRNAAERGILTSSPPSRPLPRFAHLIDCHRPASSRRHSLMPTFWAGKKVGFKKWAGFGRWP